MNRRKATNASHGSEILDRLSADPGQRTLGQLLQDREAATHEICRLCAELRQLQNMGAKRGTDAAGVIPAVVTAQRTYQAGFPPVRLLSLKDICSSLRISRSSVYVKMAEGTFPKPIHIGGRSVRWRVELIQAWVDAQIAASENRK